MFEEFGINAGYVEELHVKWLESPSAVEEKWRRYFETHDGALAPVSSSTNGTSVPSVRVRAPPVPVLTLPPRETLAPLALLDAEQAGGRIYELINAYRTRGHLYANLDPLAMAPTPATELELAKYGFSDNDLDAVFPTINLKGLGERATLREIVAHLQQTYCGSIGVEFTHIESAEQRIWLRERMEEARNRLDLHKAVALRICTRLT